MKRPWHIWLWFGLCLAIMLAAIGWVTRTTLALDRLQSEAEAQAKLEERIRFSLWQMDSLLLPLFIEESARPPALYQAFLNPAEGKGKTKSPELSQIKLLPSPLLTHTSAYVIIHFDFVPGQRPTSPQVPEGPMRALAANADITSARIAAYAQRLSRLHDFLQAGAVAQMKGSLGANGLVLLDELPASMEVNIAQQRIYPNAPPLPEPPNAPTMPQQAQLPQQAEPPSQGQQQSALAFNNLNNLKRSQYLRNADEFNQRDNVYQVVQNSAVINYLNSSFDAGGNAATNLPFKAVWVQGQLFLARRVVMDGQTHVQGCWLHWDNIKSALLDSISEALPGADLQPLPTGDVSAAGRMLAALPVKVVPPALPLGFNGRESPVRALLVTAWMGILLAALAAAFMLHGTISLSERRAAFVSSVTHELRTPLTTFKMYSEMLADGMVTDPAQQKQYLATLCAESTRLTHLVENVLAYARLERGSARRTQEKLALRDLIHRVEPRLHQRAVQAGMALQVDADDRALGSVVRVDAAAVEQILFNLVDNACKYAAPNATEKIIHLEALSPTERGRHAMLRIRDHGQGISAEAARRLFEPFGKTAQDAAHSAPGVGLGLALCRRLSRALGGDLHWIASVKGGACFELRLPVAAEAASS